ncbi:hypothetical protein TL16_g05842 [Triparma laevis f. inornata]|uniref:chorismate synthase n=1 Tax=Triparma laevis f. inornata TaxID=1714386 RepID=A0A9W7EBN7_9STRA|nr:hypothetical protein TL16_g05842 [Triparma laevis f. inornata]
MHRDRSLPLKINIKPVPPFFLVTLSAASVSSFTSPLSPSPFGLSSTTLYGNGNSFGKSFRITTYGESHGGVIIDGCPPRLPLTRDEIQVELDRRRPGQSRITTPRDEADSVEILSGVDPGSELTLGTPISMIVRNKDQRSKDYLENDMSLSYRPSHADATYDAKYGVRAVAGGGRSSARETIGRVAAGAVAKKILDISNKVEILGYVSKVQEVDCDVDPDTFTLEDVEANIVRCPDQAAAEKVRIHEKRSAELTMKNASEAPGELAITVPAQIHGQAAPA